MKLSSAIAKRIQTFFPPQCPFRNVSRFSTSYSAETQTVKTQEPSLYRRISPALGNPNDGIVPVLDEWVSEGRNVDPLELRAIIRELRGYRRHRHALEISQWMTDKRYMVLSPSDVALRLQLIAKVHTIEQAENFFDSTPNQLRTLQVYGALLFCYSEAKYIDKAEATIQKIRELGFPLSTINYNNLLTLYFRTGNREKLDTLINEMKLKSVKFDRFTYTMLLNSYGANNDIDGVEKTVEKLESDPDVDNDWVFYHSAAIHCHKCGLLEKALSLLKKAESLGALDSKKQEVFSSFLTFYTTLGKKEDVLRVWEKCKVYKLSNQCYKKMISSILKFNDIEIAETVFRDWEASCLSKDICIPNLLIKTYSKKGEMEKAEAVIEKAKLKGWEKPNMSTWYWMSLGYVKNSEMGKAVEAMGAAVLDRFSRGSWTAEKKALLACVTYLKEEGDKDRSSNFVRLLQDRNIVSTEVYERLVEYFSGEYEGEDVLGYGLGENTEYLDSQTDMNVLEKTQEPSLYRRISPALGNHRDAIVPGIDQWVSEGRNVDIRVLRTIIKELCHRRPRHALEISKWMADKHMYLSSSDVAVRLQLIAKVHSIKKVENLFDSLPVQLRTLPVYGALLFCYSEGEYVDKAEATMQKMRELGFPLPVLNYNNMLTLYFRTGNREKVDTLINEMELKSVKFDRFTYTIFLNSYGADNYVDGLEKTMEKLESDPDVDIDWVTYVRAGIQFHKCGLPEKALTLVKKAENLGALASKKHEVFSHFLTLYAILGIKEDVLRVWEKCKEYKLSNRCYMKMMSSILKLNDVETAETVLCDWQASNLSKSICIPNFLIKAYSEKGEMEKAEALIEKAKLKGWKKPNLVTWYLMSLGYVKTSEMGKAIEAMERTFPRRTRRKPEKEALLACVKYLKEEGDQDRSSNFVRLLQDRNIVSTEVYKRLVEYFSREYEGEDVLEGYGLGESTEHLQTDINDLEKLMKKLDAFSGN